MANFPRSDIYAQMREAQSAPFRIKRQRQTVALAATNQREAEANADKARAIADIVGRYAAVKKAAKDDDASEIMKSRDEVEAIIDSIESQAGEQMPPDVRKAVTAGFVRGRSDGMSAEEAIQMATTPGSIEQNMRSRFGSAAWGEDPQGFGYQPGLGSGSGPGIRGGPPRPNAVPPMLPPGFGGPPPFQGPALPPGFVPPNAQNPGFTDPGGLGHTIWNNPMNFLGALGGAAGQIPGGVGDFLSGPVIPGAPPHSNATPRLSRAGIEELNSADFDFFQRGTQPDAQSALERLLTDAERNRPDTAFTQRSKDYEKQEKERVLFDVAKVMKMSGMESELRSVLKAIGVDSVDAVKGQFEKFMELIEKSLNSSKSVLMGAPVLVDVDSMMQTMGAGGARAVGENLAQPFGGAFLGGR
jgi:hypothetical protein